MSFIGNMRKKNQFPIIFIGSGITQRYFENAPTWKGLLIKLWSMIDEENNFYKRYHELQGESLEDFEIYLRLATELEQSINDAFFNGKIQIDGIEIKDAHLQQISPFKQEIVNIFSQLTRRDGLEEEIKSFIKMLVKARFVITTNFDDFIESCYHKANTKLDIKIGNAGLFSQSVSYGELYKIHGSVGDAKSIVISESDYEHNESKLALVNAKILSNLIDSPILFLGYSLTDENVRKLLEAYVKNTPFDVEEAASRIGVVKRIEGKLDVQDVRSYISEIGINYTEIRTDNFKQIYDEISQINQGMTPAEISKYEKFLKEIIVVKGQQGKLEKVLASTEDLSKLSVHEIQTRNLVAAFGDGRYVGYHRLTYLDYIKNYFNEDESIPIDLVFNFVSHQKLTTVIPVKKYLKKPDLTTVSEKFKRDYQSVVRRKENQPQYLEELIDGKRNKSGDGWETVPVTNGISQSDLKKLETLNSVADMYNISDVYLPSKIKYITSQIKKFDLDELQDFIMSLFESEQDKVLNGTDFRKLFMAYSLII